MIALFRPTIAPALGVLAAALLLLAGCTTPGTTAGTTPGTAPGSTASATEAVIAPNPQLFAQGIPPLPRRIAERVAPYTDFRGHGFADWHPTQREMLVVHREAGANTAQLFRLTAPGAPPQRLTDGPDPVGRAWYEPRQGRYIVFERSAGGSEVGQVFRLDAALAAPVPLTDPDARHAVVGWLRSRAELLILSVPIDRTAEGGTRARIATTLSRIDPEKPGAATKLAELPGGGWFGGVVSPDERWLALNRYESAAASEVWLLDLRSGERHRVLPAADDRHTRAAHHAVAFEPSGLALLVETDRFSEFRELARLTLGDGALARISGHLGWDIDGASLAEDGSEIAALANVEGRHELHLFDARTLAERALPGGLPAGTISALHHHRASGELALTAAGARNPAQVFTRGADGGWTAWTQAQAAPGVDASRFAEQRVVRWRSFDGLAISGLLTMPPARFAGRRPVLVSIHGGPEAQARMGFLGRSQYFVEEMGFALIQPNVRGSSGFGKRFLTLDDGHRREDSVKDIGALLDWIAAQPDLDASRVVVTGGSYGGYMALAVATHYAERIAGTIDVVGISHFVTFLQRTESYRRDLRRVEYGDERDPDMAAFLHRISPLTNAERITRPLFVVAGRNDPRVPYTEAEQIVAKVRERGTPVWYLRADNEGHGFARKTNQDFQFYATVMFLEQLLQR